MKLLGTITVELGPAPTPDALEAIRERLEELLDHLEDELAGVLLDAGAGFSSETLAKVEL